MSTFSTDYSSEMNTFILYSSNLESICSFYKWFCGKENTFLEIIEQNEGRHSGKTCTNLLIFLRFGKNETVKRFQICFKY